MLIDYPFKGDETALRNMEHAELISIGINHGMGHVLQTLQSETDMSFFQAAHRLLSQVDQFIDMYSSD